MAGVIGGAEFSPCGRYRYALWRIWDGSSVAADRRRVVLTPAEITTFLHSTGLSPLPLIALNPSTADALMDDPTVRRGIGFAMGWGYGGLILLNAFAFRSTDPNGLRAVADPIGPDNDAVLLRYCAGRPLVVAGWGVHGAYRGRGAGVRDLLRPWPLHHLGLTKGGHPRHPLYLRGDVTPAPWEGPA